MDGAPGRTDDSQPTRTATLFTAETNCNSSCCKHGAAAAIAEANREKAVTLPPSARSASSSKPEKRLGDLVHSESMPRMLEKCEGATPMRLVGCLAPPGRGRFSPP